MSIQKIDATRQCQPLKQSVSAVPLRESVAFKNVSDKVINNDQFIKSNTDNTKALEAKYDFACRLAAFYKNKYEELLNDKACCV